MSRRLMPTRVVVAANTLLACLAWSLAMWDPLGIDDRAITALAFVLTGLLASNLLAVAMYSRQDAGVTTQGGPDELLRELPGYVQQLQDEERRRISRELHDSTAQTLGAAAMGLDKARRMAEQAAEPQLREVLRDIAELVDAAIQELRTRSNLLHLPVLDELRLEHMLSWYAEGFAKRSGVAVTVKIQPDLRRLPAVIELVLFRVIQEALANVYRHSGSDTGEIALHLTNESLVLEIHDQGRGLAPNLLTGEGGGGVGLSGLGERVRALGGRLEITSLDDGARVSVVLPLGAHRGDKSLLPG